METATFSPTQEFQAISEHDHAFSGVLALQSGQQKVNVATEGQNDLGAPASVNMVSGSFFPVLGVNPILGRAFTTDVDKVRDANPVAVISYAFWQSRFAGANSILGRKLRIRSTSYDVIGVAPPQFRGVTIGFAPDIWVPLTMQTGSTRAKSFFRWRRTPSRRRSRLQVLARLKPGVTVAQAKADAELTFQQYLQSQLQELGSPRETRRTFESAHRARRGQPRRLSAARQVRQAFGHPDGRRRIGTADRLRKRGESPAGARRFAPKGDCRTRFARRGAWAIVPAVADRKRDARGNQGRDRAAARAMG